MFENYGPLKILIFAYFRESEFFISVTMNRTNFVRFLFQSRRTSLSG